MDVIENRLQGYEGEQVRIHVITIQVLRLFKLLTRYEPLFIDGQIKNIMFRSSIGMNDSTFR